MKKTLVIIDVQRDFFHPEGNLSVAGADALPEKIAAQTDSYDNVVVTLDWHPGNHCSFRTQGGIWPVHCVQYTQGAGLPDCFAVPLARDGVYYWRKGCKQAEEQYGAFEGLQPDDPVFRVFAQSDVLDVCGIAGDYCVKETLVRLIDLGFKQNIRVRTGLVASIDDGSTLERFIKENGIAYEE